MNQGKIGLSIHQNPANTVHKKKCIKTQLGKKHKFSYRIKNDDCYQQINSDKRHRHHGKGKMHRLL